MHEKSQEMTVQGFESNTERRSRTIQGQKVPGKNVVFCILYILKGRGWMTIQNGGVAKSKSVRPHFYGTISNQLISKKLTESLCVIVIFFMKLFESYYFFLSGVCWIEPSSSFLGTLSTLDHGFNGVCARGNGCFRCWSIYESFGGILSSLMFLIMTMRWLKVI